MSATHAGEAQVVSSSAPLLTLRGIGKSFRGAHALDGVDLDIRAGETHALLGENGAGKSTPMKILSGIYQPVEGSITLVRQRHVPVGRQHHQHPAPGLDQRDHHRRHDAGDAVYPGLGAAGTDAVRTLRLCHRMAGSIPTCRRS